MFGSRAGFLVDRVIVSDFDTAMNSNLGNRTSALSKLV